MERRDADRQRYDGGSLTGARVALVIPVTAGMAGRTVTRIASRSNMTRPKAISQEEYNRRRRENYRADGGRRRELSRIYMNSYRKKRPDVYKKSSAKSRAKRFITPEGRAASLLESCRRRAIKKNIPFDLDRDWMHERIVAGCELTGLPFTLAAVHVGRGPLSASVDRRDNSKGYTKDNCRLIAWALNSAFGTWGENQTLDVLLAYAKTLCK